MTGLVKHAAPGPYLGFALQPVRLCYYLLRSPPESSVSLEFLDDVAIHHADGSVVVEQCKSSLSHNALSDWSEDLWKTIAIWLDMVESPELDVSRFTFHLYVTPKKAGTLSSAIHDAATVEDVNLLVEQVRDKLMRKVRPPKCMLPSFSTPPKPSDAKALLINRPMFVRQLQLIEATEEQQLRAASDLMRTSGDKAKWAEQGLFFDGSFDDWENSLLRKHAAVQSEVKDIHSDKSEIVQGRTVYNRCSALDVPLNGRAVPEHFTHGSFNDLADRQKLGWHQEYRALLNKESEK